MQKPKDDICPVCASPTAAGYLSKPTVCPCCGSDLEPFMAADKLAARGRARYVWAGAATIAAIAAVAFGLLWLTAPLGRPLTTVVHDTVTVAADSPGASQAPYKYIVRKGDSWWSISRRLYGTGTRAGELAAANGTDTGRVLQIGDSLNVTLTDYVPY